MFIQLNNKTNQKSIHLKNKFYLFQIDTEEFLTNPVSVDVSTGDNVSLECVSGLSAPPPTMTWLKDGGMVENEMIVDTGEMVDDERVGNFSVIVTSFGVQVGPAVQRSSKLTLKV